MMPRKRLVLPLVTTVLTLVMVPTLYSITEEIKIRMGWARVTSVKGVPMMVIEAPDPEGMRESREYAGNVAKVEALAADLLGSLGRRKNLGRSDEDTEEGDK